MDNDEMTNAELFERKYDEGYAKYGYNFRRAILAVEKVFIQYNVQNVPKHALIVDTVQAVFESIPELIQLVEK